MHGFIYYGSLRSLGSLLTGILAGGIGSYSANYVVDGNLVRINMLKAELLGLFFIVIFSVIRERRMKNCKYR